MKAFKRVFSYMWPQWPRIIATILCALIVAVLLSLSYVTVIPILKVMIEGQGLHPWVDGKICSTRYGLEFFKQKTSVAVVKPKGLAHKSGLQDGDTIVGILTPNEPNLAQNIPYARLLEKLSTTEQPTLTLRVARAAQNISAAPEVFNLTLLTPFDTTTVNQLDWSVFKQIKWKIQLATLAMAQRALRFIPRGNSPENTMRATLFIVLLIFVVTCIRCVFKFFQAYLSEKVVQVCITSLRQDVFNHVTHMPMDYFANERPSDTMSRIIRDTGEMSVALKAMLGKAMREPLNALASLTLAMLINWQLTLIFMCGGPFVVFCIAKFGKTMHRATRKSLEAASQMLSKLEETLVGLKVVKVYNQQEHEQRSFRQINQRLFKQQMKISRVESAASPTLEIFGIAAGCAAILLGTHWVTQQDLAHRIDGPAFLGLLVLLGASAESARKVSDVWNKIQRANAAAVRIFSLLDLPVEKEEPNAPHITTHKKSIEFREITFTYPGGREPVLHGVNLIIEAGKNVAVVGPNGSGKTTLASLLPRFYDPDSGEILIDGQSIHKISLQSLRRQIGMVTQNIISFNDTVANNIAYGKPGATREEVITASRQAFAHEFVQALPLGYDTVIGEHGTGLSGGQLQRIVIARAVLKNPPILIFDEATSQVDAESEAKIHEAIQRIMSGRTTLIIAHRFSTVVAADQIVVIGNGRVVAQGTHEELIHQCDLYQGLYETQLIKS